MQASRWRVAQEGFNTQPPEGGCWTGTWPARATRSVSTHSRPKAAAHGIRFFVRVENVSTHSRPKAAAHSIGLGGQFIDVSTHSRPKAAAPIRSRAAATFSAFQHTAARRRLPSLTMSISGGMPVSTHSRPKAAAAALLRWAAAQTVSTHSRPKAAALVPQMTYSHWCLFQHTAARRRLPPATPLRWPRAPCFNTQPPEGGCANRYALHQPGRLFQHTVARRRLPDLVETDSALAEFQHTAARRRLPGPASTPTCKPWFQHTAARRRLRAPDDVFALMAGFNTQPPEGGCPRRLPHKQSQ